jgi:predicted branched-subunit amino acid permease
MNSSDICFSLSTGPRIGLVGDAMNPTFHRPSTAGRLVIVGAAAAGKAQGRRGPFDLGMSSLARATVSPDHRQVVRASVEVFHGARQMAPLALSYAPFGVVIGAAGSASDAPLSTLVAGVVVYGGSAQLTLTQMLSEGAMLWLAIASAALINLRLAVYATALAPLWSGTRPLTRLVAAMSVIDPTWALANRRAEAGGTLEQRRAHYAGAAVTLTLVWLLSLAVGLALGASTGLTTYLAIGLPLCLLALVLPHRHRPGGTAVLVVAALAAAVAIAWPAGTGVLLAMGLGVAVGAIRSRRRPS